MACVLHISKMLERLFLSCLNVTSSPHFNHLQSAYCKFHSTESALLHTFDSIYRLADQSKPLFLVSLDLSAAFDTIDHSTLLNRLSTSFFVHGSALAWLTSYLSDRSQTIRIGSAASGPSKCQSGVPPGSVLGPILFSLYISPLGHIISSFNISHQHYADDSQLYISLVADSIRASLDRLETCLSAVRSWLCTNGLCLNPDKSDSIILGTHQRLCTFPAIPAFKIAGIDINISNEITSLGVVMDPKLTLDSHISAICKSCYYHLRSLHHIRRSLTQGHGYFSCSSYCAVSSWLLQLFALWHLCFQYQQTSACAEPCCETCPQWLAFTFTHSTFEITLVSRPFPH